MNHCLNCGKLVKNKYCNVSCQNKHLNGLRANKKYGERKIFIVKCFKCNKEINTYERCKLFPQKDKYFCSINCANSHIRTEESKQKTRNILLDRRKNILHNDVIKICKECKNEFKIKWEKRNQKCCSKKCSDIYDKNKYKRGGSKGGLKSAHSQNRRSKNEIYFAELCMQIFYNVLLNQRIFNGWDADIILENEKIAILWNGRWHYEKLNKKHSIKQVQNRDRIKTKEIKIAGYIPYIIKDMGKYNKEFVEKQFEIFKKYCALEK